MKGNRVFFSSIIMKICTLSQFKPVPVKFQCIKKKKTLSLCFEKYFVSVNIWTWTRDALDPLATDRFDLKTFPNRFEKVKDSLRYIRNRIGQFIIKRVVSSIYKYKREECRGPVGKFMRQTRTRSFLGYSIRDVMSTSWIMSWIISSGNEPKTVQTSETTLIFAERKWPSRTRDPSSLFRENYNCRIAAFDRQNVPPYPIR